MGLLEGKLIAQRIKQGLRDEIQTQNLKPVLASIQVGEDQAAEAYCNSQRKLAQRLGIEYKFYKLEKEIKEQALIDFIVSLNQNKEINAIILQLPLPAHIDYKKMSKYIAANKDAEGMNPANIGEIVFAKANILPCTAAAVMELLNETGIDLDGKEVVIVGHSEIVGKPLSLLLLEKFATVTVCHIGTSRANKLQEHVKRAEVLIVAVGKANLIKGEWVKKDAVVIDVGIDRKSVV